MDEDQTMRSPSCEIPKPVKVAPRFSNLPSNDQDIMIDCDCGVHVIFAVLSRTHQSVLMQVNLSGWL